MKRGNAPSRVFSPLHHKRRNGKTPECLTGRAGGVLFVIRDRLHQALDHPEHWLGLRRSGSVEVELERRARTVPFLDLNADAKRVLSEGLDSSLDHLRQGIDANLRTLDIDTSLRYLHWCIYEVMPKLQSSLARSALEKNEAHQLAWQPCTLTMNDLLGTGNCGIWVTNEIREALERVGLQLRKESISS